MSKPYRRLLLSMTLLVGVSATARAEPETGYCWHYLTNCCVGGGSHFCYRNCPNEPNGAYVMNAVAASFCLS